jgi:hypothetical protein
MKTIWKYTIDHKDSQDIRMPKGAFILTAQNQNNQLFLWAEVNPKATKETRVIEIFGTGTPIEEDMGVERKYIATVQEDVFVWHVYERL